MLTLRLKKLQLSVEKVQVRLSEDDFWRVVITRATTDIARVGGSVGSLIGRGVVLRCLRRHGE